jgi:hydrogenase maturation protease
MPRINLHRTTVLGLGNPLMGDDCLGLTALSRLEEEWFVPRFVSLVDGGTWGMNLLPVVESTDRLLVLDAIDVGAAPGTIVRLAGEEVPRVLGQKLSPHQIDLREVLALAELRGSLPSQLVALGIQPERIELGTDLTPAVNAGVDQLVEIAIATLGAWGINCVPLTRAARAVPRRRTEDAVGA